MVSNAMLIGRTFLFRWIGAIVIVSVFSFIFISQRYSTEYQISNLYTAGVYSEPVTPRSTVASSASKGYYHRKLSSTQYRYTPCEGVIENDADITLYYVWDQLMNGSRSASNIALGSTSAVTKPVSPSNEQLRIFVVPFSHVDPGWLKTFGEYFNETDETLRLAVEFLDGHPEMRFMWAEMSFLKHFWDFASEDTRNKMRRQVRSGQFDLVTGSWTMTDEANPYFWASIDNMIEGHQFLLQAFGIIPNVSWTNDPFGYSTAVPILFQKAGIHQFIINRIHDSYKTVFRNTQNLEFLWRPILGNSVRQDALTHVLPYGHYDILNSCGPSPSDCCEFDFKRITHFSCPGAKPVKITTSNVEAKAAQLIEQLRERQKLTRHPNVLYMLGDDFRYKDRQEWYQQYDNYKMLFDYINSKKDWNVKAKFGTISEYFSKIEGIGPHLSTVRGDFFPYSDNGYDYWTGYFTSRAFYKKLDRILQSHVRTADIFSTLALTSPKLTKSHALELAKEYYNKLDMARKNLALFQHHDAITGTSKAHVMVDYGKRLIESIKLADGVLASSVVILGSRAKSISVSEVDEGAKDIMADAIGNQADWETRLIDLEDGSTQYLYIVNSLPYKRQELIRLNVKNPYVAVLDKGSGKAIKAQIQPQFGFNHYVALYSYKLIFLTELPPLSLTVIQLKGHSSLPTTTILAKVAVYKDAPRLAFPKIFDTIELQKTEATLKGSKHSTVHDSKTGFLKGFIDSTGTYHSLSLSLLSYEKSDGGAYIFHPSKAPHLYCNRTNRVAFLSGPIINEVNLFCTGVWHRETFLSQGTGQMVAFVRNMVDIKGKYNFELIQHATSNVHNNGIFYTDEVGYQILRRKFYRNQPMEVNYYPIPSSIYIEDGSWRLTVLTGQPHGGTSPRQGTIEIMLDRTLAQDDSRGMFEAVKDNVRTVSDFVITLESKVTSSTANVPHQSNKLTGSLSLLGIQMMQRFLYPVQILHSADSKNTASNYHAIQRSLPCYVNLLSLRQLTNPGPSFLIVHRSHIDCSYASFITGNSEDSCSKGTIDALYDLLVTLNVARVIETSLSGVYDMTEVALHDMPQYLTPMNISAYKLYFHKFL